jgi:hypothetical protein
VYLNHLKTEGLSQEFFSARADEWNRCPTVTFATSSSTSALICFPSSAAALVSNATALPGCSSGRKHAYQGIVKWMVRRLVPLMLAVIVGTSPTVRDWCAVFCAQPVASAAAATHEHHGSGHSAAGPAAPAHDVHGGHSHATPQAETSIAGRSNEPAMPCCTLSLFEASIRCLHDGSSEAAFAPITKPALDPPVARPQVVTGVGPPPSAAAVLRVASAASPPNPLALRTPLRV